MKRQGFGLRCLRSREHLGTPAKNLSPEPSEGRRELSDCGRPPLLSEADPENVSWRASAEMCPKQMLPKHCEPSAATDKKCLEHRERHDNEKLHHRDRELTPNARVKPTCVVEPNTWQALSAMCLV